MDKLEVTWSHAIAIWWSYLWRCFLGSVVLGAILGFTGGLIVSLAGRSDLGGPVGTILGYIGSFPVSIYFLKKILNKKYKDFSIVLVQNAN